MQDNTNQFSPLITEGNVINTYVLTDVQAHPNYQLKQKAIQRTIDCHVNKDSIKLSQSSIKASTIDKKLSTSHELKNTNLEFFQNHVDIESKIVIILDKVKHEIFTNSDNRIKQYGLLFQFISSNLKEINEMVNNDEEEAPSIHVNYIQDRKRSKEEELKIGLMNKIDEVSSNKVSSLSSLKIPHSKKSSNDLNYSENNSHKQESKHVVFSKHRREERSRRIVNNSKLSNNISSINSEHLKNIIEDSGVGKGYLSDEVSSMKSHDDKSTKRIKVNNINNNYINKNKTSTNFQFNFYIKNELSARRKKNNGPYCESIDSDKTKEKFPLNEYYNN
jgi:hypothetical protein